MEKKGQWRRADLAGVVWMPCRALLERSTLPPETSAGCFLCQEGWNGFDSCLTSRYFGGGCSARGSAHTSSTRQEGPGGSADQSGTSGRLQLMVTRGLAQARMKKRGLCAGAALAVMRAKQVLLRRSSRREVQVRVRET